MSFAEPSSITNSSCATSDNETITDMLTSLSTQSKVTIRSGCYELTKTVIVKNSRNVSLVCENCSQPEDKVSITCQMGTGLVFMNVHGLLLENVAFYGCNLTGSSLEDAIGDVNATMILFHTIPLGGLSVGLLIADCQDVQLLKMTVAGTPGLGILGINWLGTSILEQVILTNNAPSECDLTNVPSLLSMPTTGGGMYLLYTDYRNITEHNITVLERPTVNIVNSTFEFNQDCSLYNYVPQFYETSEVARDVGYRFGSSAGFGLELTQIMYSVNVTVASTIFYKNMAEYLGGALHVGHFQGSSDNCFAVTNCSFFNNGFPSLPNVYSYGGAMAIYLNNKPPSEVFDQPVIPQEVKANVIIISDTKFSDNTASFYGVGYIFATDSPFTTFENENRVVFQNCSFQQNTVEYRTVLGIVAYKYNGQLDGVQVYMNGVTFTGNEI